MPEPSVEQIRYFRLCSHHLNTEAQGAEIGALAGACGLQNTPPGAWETALFNRAPTLSLAEMECALYRDKTLLQAWSFRGAPVVFPARESAVFLSALAAQGDEPWIYTQGIALALDALRMPFDELLSLMLRVMPQLNGQTVTSKSALDQTVADWMLPLLPESRREGWNRPSMYGRPDVQTVGGAVVSFLLRPCAFLGLVVFGERDGNSPAFTSYRSWTGRALEAERDAPQKLARKFLHCYGPTTPDAFARWLGSSGQQARRIWRSVSEEMEPVALADGKAFLLSVDREALLCAAPPERELLLLGGHDPYLDQRDRGVVLPEKRLHKQVWTYTANPGAIVYRGEIIGIWTGKKTGKGMEVHMTRWGGSHLSQRLHALAEKYAAFRRQRLLLVEEKEA